MSCEVWNGMEWSGMEWNGLSCNVLCRLKVHKHIQFVIWLST
jgi:hypothetical protein